MRLAHYNEEPDEDLAELRELAKEVRRIELHLKVHNCAIITLCF